MNIVLGHYVIPKAQKLPLPSGEGWGEEITTGGSQIP